MEGLVLIYVVFGAKKKLSELVLPQKFTAFDYHLG